MADLVIAIRAQNQAQAALNSVKGSIGQIQQAAQNATAQMRAMGDSLKNVGGKMSLAVTAPVLGFVGAALKGAMANEQLEVSFTTMLGSAEKAKKMMADLSKFAASTPFESPEIQGAAKQLLAFGVDAENIIPTLTQLGDVAAGLNIPLGDMAYLFGTAKASGRLFAADINQFAGRGVPIIEYLAKAMGVAQGEVKGLVEAGKVGFPELQKAFELMTSEGGKFSGLMAAQSQTLAGLLSTFRDNIGLALTAIGKQMIESFDLKGVLTNLNAQLEKASKAVINFAQTQPKLFKFIAIFVGIAAALGPLLIGLGILMTSLAPLAPAIAAIGGAFTLLLGPIGLVVAALAALIAFDVGGIRTKLMGVVDSFKEWLGISAQVEGQSIKMGASIGKMSPAMQRLQGIVGTVASAWDKWTDALSRAENAMGKMHGAVQMERFAKLPDPAVIDRVAQAFVRVRDALADFISTGDTSGIEAIFNSIRKAVANLDLPSISEVWELAKVEITTFVKNFTWDVPGDVFNGLKTAVMDQLRSIWDNLFGGGETASLKGVDNTLRYESALGVGKKNMFDPLIDLVMDQLESIDWGAALGGIGKGATNLFVGVKDFVLQQLTAIDWSALASGVGKGAGNLFDGVKDFVQIQMTAIDWSALGGVGKGAKDFFAPLTTWVGEQLAAIDWAALPGETLTKLQEGATILKDTIASTLTAGLATIDFSKLTEVFDPNTGILATISNGFRDAITSVSASLDAVDAEALGQKFGPILGGIALLVGFIANAQLTDAEVQVMAIVGLGTSILNFISDFGKGLDVEILSTAISGFATTFTEKLTAVFGNEENMTALGAAAGTLGGTIITKIGEFFAKPGFGEEMGEAAGGAASALATGAMSIVTGFATELGKVPWDKVVGQLQSFVAGFASGVAAQVGGQDWGPVAKAMVDALAAAVAGMIGAAFPAGVFGTGTDPYGLNATMEKAQPVNLSPVTIEGESPDDFFKNFGVALWEGQPQFMRDITLQLAPNVADQLVLKAPTAASLPLLTFAPLATSGIETDLPAVAATAGQSLVEEAAKIVWPPIPPPVWTWPVIPAPAWIETLRSVMSGASGLASGPSLSDQLRSTPLPDLGQQIRSALSSFTWPKLPAWSWPPMPTFTWPSLPTFKWPSLPKWTWPPIPTPGWVNQLLNWSPPGAPEAAAAAVGTANFRGGLTWVGETGPELVMLPRKSRVWSNSESEAMTSGEQTIIHIENMNVRSDTDIHAIAYQIDDLRRQRRSRR